MLSERFYNDKGQPHGFWSTILIDGYFKGYYINNVRLGVWEFSQNEKIFKIYYAT